MKLGLDIRASLSQTLTPQQIQYLKLLQMPLVQLEQQVRQEIEMNPMLEDFSDPDIISMDDVPQIQNEDTFTHTDDDFDYDNNYTKSASPEYEDYEQAKKFIDDEAEPFEFHKMLWDGGDEYGKNLNSNSNGDDDGETFQIKDNSSLMEDLMQQLRLLPISRDEFFIGEQILGNVDSDGYLRREIEEIIDEVNEIIEDINFEAEKAIRLSNLGQNLSNTLKNGENPAKMYALSAESANALTSVTINNPEMNLKIDPELANYLAKVDANLKTFEPIKKASYELGEKILGYILNLEPAGIGARSVQESLLCQCKAFQKPNAAQKLAIEILENYYDAFAKKHYHVITKQLEITDDYLKEALEIIKRLNPRPGGGDFQAQTNTVIPDFTIEKDEDDIELLISVNDSRMPTLQLSKAYENMKKEAKYKLYNKDTRDWIRNKFEDAKFLIQALRQRKNTMMKVMTAIAGLQRDFFFEGPSVLKPLIYKDISEETGLDISTVCRIVNGKYIQTDFGTFELKFFFSESLPTDEGEEVSTRVIKQILKDIIIEESKLKPLSDDELSRELKERGFNVARRTVAKYREQLKLPVARLRRELA